MRDEAKTGKVSRYLAVNLLAPCHSRIEASVDVEVTSR